MAVAVAVGEVSGSIGAPRAAPYMTRAHAKEPFYRLPWLAEPQRSGGVGFAVASCAHATRAGGACARVQCARLC